MDREDKGTGDRGVDRRISQANLTLRAGGRDSAARRGGAAFHVRTGCEERRQVDAGVDGFAGQGIFIGAVCEVSRRLSGSESSAAGAGRGRARWIQWRNESRGAAYDFTGEDDAGARASPCASVIFPSEIVCCAAAFVSPLNPSGPPTASTSGRGFRS